MRAFRHSQRPDWRLLLRADRIRRGLWPGLICCIWGIGSCAHSAPPPIAPRAALVRYAVYPVQEIVDTLHLPSGRRPVCRFQVLSDSTLAMPPTADARDQHYCAAAFERWARRRQPQAGPPR